MNVPLADVADIQGGLQVTPKRAALPMEAPYLRVANVFRDRLDLGEVKRIRVSPAELDRTRLVAGDLLVVEGHGNPDELGRVAVWDASIPDCTHQNHLIRVRLKPRSADPRYVSRFLNSPTGRTQLLRMGKTTSGLNTISTSQVADLRIPLPGLDEQRRIAAILDEADALRRKRREALALLDELLPSAFLELFGDPVTNPRAWPLVPLSQVISEVEAGWSANGLDRPAGQNEWGVLKVSAVSTGGFREDENKVVREPDFRKPPVTPRRGDLLFSRANTREFVAATCLVETNAPLRFLPDKLWRISTDGDVACVEWLRFLLANEGYRASLAKRATGTSGSMLNVSQQKLLDMLAPVPPIDRQRRFASLAWSTLAQRRQTEAGSEASNELIASLLDRAFAGKL